MLTVPGEMVTFDENGGKSTLEAIGKRFVPRGKNLAIVSFQIKGL